MQTWPTDIKFSLEWNHSYRCKIIESIIFAQNISTHKTWVFSWRWHVLLLINQKLNYRTWFYIFVFFILKFIESINIADRSCKFRTWSSKFLAGLDNGCQKTKYKNKFTKLAFIPPNMMNGFWFEGKNQVKCIFLTCGKNMLIFNFLCLHSGIKCPSNQNSSFFCHLIHHLNDEKHLFSKY